MRCYFHLVNGKERIIDEEGTEARDLEMAHAKALRAIEELRQEALTLAAESGGWSLIIAEGTEKPLLSVPLDTSAQ